MPTLKYRDPATGNYYNLSTVGPQGPAGAAGSQGIQGIQGPPGATGQAEAWFSQSGAPAGATGAVGDWSLDTTSGDVYEKTGASTWTQRANIRGPQGIQGIQGPSGGGTEVKDEGTSRGTPAGVNFVGEGVTAGVAAGGVVDVTIPGAPVGSIVMWPTATPPTGWLICNGGTFVAATYPLLNTLLGGNTLPDMQDRFPIGASGTKAALTTGGAATKQLVAANLPGHQHPIRRGTAVGTSGVNVAQGNATAAADTNTSPDAAAGTAFDVMNPWRSLNFIIKAA